MPGCLHRSKILKCKECKEMFCARCIQLEVHCCPGLDERTKIEKENLAKKLVKVEGTKLLKI